MSSYLVNEIRYSSRIAVQPCSEVAEVGGDGRLEWLDVSRTPTTGERQPAQRRGPVPAARRRAALRLAARRAWPATSAASCSPAATCPRTAGSTACRRENLATTVPGIFAAGDIRVRLDEAGRRGERRGRLGGAARARLSRTGPRVTGAGRAELNTGALRGWVRQAGPQRALFLHGGPGLGYEYLDGLLAELDGWSVASFQQRGIPPSTLDGPFDIATAVGDITTVLDELGWRSDTYLLGHSWGGYLALHAARSLANRLAGVLAVDPIGVVGDGGTQEFEEELLRRTPPRDRARVEEIGDTDDEELADEALRLLWPSYFADGGSAPPYVSFPISQHAYLRLTRQEAELRPALEAALTSLTVPLGIVMGAASPIPQSAGADIVERVQEHGWRSSPTPATSSGSRRPARYDERSTGSREAQLR